LDEVLKRLNNNARIPLCGMISQYNLTNPEGIHNLTSLIVNRAMMQGFIVSDHLERWPAALAELGAWLAAGKLKYKEDIAEGLANAPKAFIAMLSGKNLGKQLVRLGPEKG
jgi:NADPH-dependent curcumin reductase CurA